MPSLHGPAGGLSTTQQQNCPAAEAQAGPGDDWEPVGLSVGMARDMPAGSVGHQGGSAQSVG